MEREGVSASARERGGRGQVGWRGKVATKLRGSAYHVRNTKYVSSAFEI